MIVPALKGGLGNQLFQISTAICKAEQEDTGVAINYNFKHPKGQGNHPNNYKDNLYKKIPTIQTAPDYIVHEQGFCYSSLPSGKDMTLDGYFQSEKYFPNYKEKLDKVFCFPDIIKEKINKNLAKLNKKILGIHIRLGDFYKMYSNVHLVCTKNYYSNALKRFNLNDYIVVVTTDDYENFQKYLPIDNFILCNSKNEIEDLYLLSQCDGLIISNSTFSWWGAYLGKIKKTVCAPEKWFASDGPKDYKDIYIKGWEKIEI
jgi:hypothetical protein